MLTELAVTLPRGLFDRNHGQHRHAVLSALTGELELQLAEASELAPETVTALLARAFRRLGGYERVEPLHAAALSRGDRDFALLHLRRSIFGDRLALVVGCPNPACLADADLTLRISELAPPPELPAPETLSVATSAGTITLREPTGADDDAVHGLEPAAASAALWTRLIVDWAGSGPISAEQWLGVAPDVRQALALALADGASGPTLAFTAPCPSCRGWMEVELEPAALLQSELGVAVDRLFAEVHTLAYHYHWSEHEILSLPRARRHRYLELLGRQVATRKP